MVDVEGERAPVLLGVPVITEDFLRAYKQKFPTHQKRTLVVEAMEQRLAQRQAVLYKFIQDEAASSLATRIPQAQLADAMRRVRFGAVDLYSLLCEQKQHDRNEFSQASVPDDSKIVPVTPRSIFRFGNQEKVYLRRTAEDRGKIFGPRERILTHLHSTNPILHGRIRNLLGSFHVEERVLATTSAAMLAVIALQARQTPFAS